VRLLCWLWKFEGHQAICPYSLSNKELPTNYTDHSLAECLNYVYKHPTYDLHHDMILNITKYYIGYDNLLTRLYITMLAYYVVLHFSSELGLCE